MLILESIVTTRDADGAAHIAPMGVWATDAGPVLAPFKPSATLDNLLRERCAVINRTDDVRIFAHCLSDRHQPPLCAAERVPVARLKHALSHAEVEVTGVEDDELRPRLQCRTVHEAVHAPFAGFNRAQAAVLELAILVSRLDRLAEEKIMREIDYLKIAVGKTAGAREREAWDQLMAEIEKRRAGGTPE